jgi:hypothetical protein
VQERARKSFRLSLSHKLSLTSHKKPQAVVTIEGLADDINQGLFRTEMLDDELNDLLANLDKG